MLKNDATHEYMNLKMVWRIKYEHATQKLSMNIK